jgi:hypothetical protein
VDKKHNPLEESAMSVSTHNIYATNLDQNAANFTPLTPLTFIERAASVYPHYHIAVVHGSNRRSWAKPIPAADGWLRHCASAVWPGRYGGGDAAEYSGDV